MALGGYRVHRLSVLRFRWRQIRCLLSDRLGPRRVSTSDTHLGQWDKLSFQQLRLFPEAHGFLGFVVIAAQNKRWFGPNHSGRSDFLIAANSNPASIFFHKLNTNQIGAFGHSQGATGAINVLEKSAGTIKTVMPIELPEQLFCSSPQNCADTSTLTQGSIS